MISASFADIFFNCFKSGILRIVVKPDELEKLLDDADGGVIKFDIDAFKKHCLLNGLDDIGLTLEKATAIDSFEKATASSGLWA